MCCATWETSASSSPRSLPSPQPRFGIECLSVPMGLNPWTPALSHPAPALYIAPEQPPPSQTLT